jgi:hypothetical protein
MGGLAQNPWDGTSSAALNLFDRFWQAIRPVSSTMASSPNGGADGPAH